MLQPGFSKSSQHLPLLGRRPSITRIQPEVLNSWKQISAFVGRGVRTVQRWERSSGMPVHRIGHGNRAPVYVLVNELNYWLASRKALILMFHTTRTITANLHSLTRTGGENLKFGPLSSRIQRSSAPAGGTPPGTNHSASVATQG